MHFILIFMMSLLSAGLSAHTAIVDKQGKPCPALVSLLKVTGVEHDGTLSSIVDATQNLWLRKQGTERWEIEEQVHNNIDQIYTLFGDLGMVHEIHAAKKSYNYLLFLGCSLPAVRARLVFMQQQWDRGVRFENIVVIGGPRPLDDSRESVDKLLRKPHEKLPFKNDWVAPQQLPTTEFEMMKMVWNQSDIYKNIINLPFSWIDVPMVVVQRCKCMNRDHWTYRRPGTVDLLNTWLKTDPKKGSCLVISSQPFVGYQHSAVATVLEEAGFEVETIGYNAVLEGRVKTYLDNIARWLYQEKKRLNL